MVGADDYGTAWVLLIRWPAAQPGRNGPHDGPWSLRLRSGGFAADVEGRAGLADLPASRSAADLVWLPFDVELRVPLMPADHATRVLHGHLQNGDELDPSSCARLVPSKPHWRAIAQGKPGATEATTDRCSRPVRRWHNGRNIGNS